MRLSFTGGGPRKLLVTGMYTLDVTAMHFQMLLEVRRLASRNLTLQLYLTSKEYLLSTGHGVLKAWDCAMMKMEKNWGVRIADVK